MEYYISIMIHINILNKMLRLHIFSTSVPFVDVFTNGFKIAGLFHNFLREKKSPHGLKISHLDEKEPCFVAPQNRVLDLKDSFFCRCRRSNRTPLTGHSESSVRSYVRLIDNI